MKARFPGTCSICGCPIRVGQEITGRGKAVRHVQCPHDIGRKEAVEKLITDVCGQKPKRICAWCGKIMAEGSEPATHGICPECEAKQEV